MGAHTAIEQRDFPEPLGRFDQCNNQFPPRWRGLEFVRESPKSSAILHRERGQYDGAPDPARGCQRHERLCRAGQSSRAQKNRLDPIERGRETLRLARIARYHVGLRRQ
jgi:hypothetical protein